MIDVLDASVDEVLRACDRAAGVRSGEGAGLLVDDLDRAASTRKRRPADARRTLAGRAALRLVTAARLGLDVASAASIPVDRACERCSVPHGRPRVAGLSASSSSSYDRVLVAVADSAVSVGVDVERIPEHLFSGFDDVALHPHERDTLPPTPVGIAARIGRWVEKEAVLKSVGIGLGSPMDALRVAPPPRDVSTVGGVVVDPPQWRHVSEAGTPGLVGLAVTALPAPRGYRSALAAREPQRVRLLDLDALVPHQR